MPGGDPLTWDLEELNNAITARKSDRDFIKKMAHYIVFWIAGLGGNKANITDLSPDYFLLYLDQETRKKNNRPRDTAPSLQDQENAKKINLMLYQKFMRRKNANQKN